MRRTHHCPGVGQQRINTITLVSHNPISEFTTKVTAESFARNVGQEISEELASMKNRQHIQKLVMSGKIGEAIMSVEQLYPGLLPHNPDLHFKLKVRQFIEMVSGADTLESEHDTSSNSGHSGHMETEHENDNHANDDNDNNSQVNGNTSNGNLEPEHSTDHNMEIETSHRDNNSILSNPARFETLVRFGRGLHVFSEQLEQERGRNSVNVQILQEAFSLLAYADPWNSPVGAQLDPAGREPVCAQLNSAILESKHLPGRPPLEVSVAHTSELLKLMSASDLGACAFANMESLLK